MVAGLFIPAALLYSSHALAQYNYEAYATTDVNMRTGPGTSYQVITVVPAGACLH